MQVFKMEVFTERTENMKSDKKMYWWKQVSYHVDRSLLAKTFGFEAKCNDFANATHLYKGLEGIKLTCCDHVCITL